MAHVDVPEVSRIERRCFSNPWPISAYRRELRNPRQNTYIVLRNRWDPGVDATAAAATTVVGRNYDGLKSLARFGFLHLRRFQLMQEGPHIAGFAGMWSVFDEAHITTIGVDPHYRGRGFGEVLLAALFEEAVRRGAVWVTLEVRVSNDVAQRLYLKYGMTVQGTRKRYYSDNGEDAYVMWSRSLRDLAYLAEIDRVRGDLERRLQAEVEFATPTDAVWASAERNGRDGAS